MLGAGSSDMDGFLGLATLFGYYNHLHKDPETLQLKPNSFADMVREVQKRERGRGRNAWRGADRRQFDDSDFFPLAILPRNCHVMSCHVMSVGASFESMCSSGCCSSP